MQRMMHIDEVGGHILPAAISIETACDMLRVSSTCKVTNSEWNLSKNCVWRLHSTHDRTPSGKWIVAFPSTRKHPKWRQIMRVSSKHSNCILNHKTCTNSIFLVYKTITTCINRAPARYCEDLRGSGINAKTLLEWVHHRSRFYSLKIPWHPCWVENTYVWIAIAIEWAMICLSAQQGCHGIFKE